MSKKLWGGRFSKKTNSLVEDFTKSIQYDYKLGIYDVLGSGAHVEILKNVGLLTPAEAKKLGDGLELIFEKMRKGKFSPKNKKCEDIHTVIQNELQKKVKDLALKLHTARSRNDQVVFATKFYCKWGLKYLNTDIGSLEKAIKELANKNKNIIVPGFTHMQHAQPVYLKDYLLTYVDMLERDKNRLESIFDRITISLGAGAMAGTPIDANQYAKGAAKFLKSQPLAKIFNIKPTTNSLDVVSDRDFVIEILSAISILGMHFSRLSEDLIIWSTKEFDFVEIDEAFCTGSSLMPQKKNPDVLELIRGYAGRFYGNLISVLTMMKGLPLTYNRDMQLDKEPLFDSFKIASKALKVMTGLVSTLIFNEDKIKEHLKDESLYATDLVYYLVNRKVPFKNAHTIVGKLVRDSFDKPGGIQGMSDKDLKKYSDKFVQSEIVKLFNPKVSVESKKSIKRN